MFIRHAQHRRSRVRPAFTLVEVLISIALVLIIILGVNQVFALTSRTIGAGNAMSTIVRDARNAQTVFTRDVAGIEIDRAPFFILKSEVFVGFRNRADQLSDRDYVITDRNQGNTDRRIATIDRDGNGTEELTPRALLSQRTHRADQVHFFVRSSRTRQTGGPNSFSSNVASSEQYVTYGHVRQPSRYVNPSSPSFTGVDGLGHLPGIVASNATPAGGCETPNTNPNNFYATQWVLGRHSLLLREPVANVIKDNVTGDPQFYYAKSTTVPMSPLAGQSPATDGGTTKANHWIEHAFYDLAGTSIEKFRSDMPTPLPANWWNTFIVRSNGSPSPNRPLTWDGVARTVPCLVPSCTQFVVEFAGDFISQNAAGGTTGVASASGGTDGVVDFILVPGTGERVIRWYGFPRDVTGDGSITRARDVVPLRDVAGQQLAFERQVPTQRTEYAAPVGAAQITTDPVAASAQYRCVWGPDTASLPRPKMLRIVMAIDDPAARIGGEQYFEFVVELP
jgi:prepilin-type N-terminal cleavage/methylation domain-containing protein